MDTGFFLPEVDTLPNVQNHLWRVVFMLESEEWNQLAHAKNLGKDMSRRGELMEQEKACCILDMDRNPELLEENSECPLWSQVSRAEARSHKSPAAHSKLLKTNVKLFVRSNFVSALVID